MGKLDGAPQSASRAWRQASGERAAPSDGRGPAGEARPGEDVATSPSSAATRAEPGAPGGRGAGSGSSGGRRRRAGGPIVPVEIEGESWRRDEAEVRDRASAAVARGARAPQAASLEEEVRAELARAGGPTLVPRYESRLEDAARAYEAERYGDAARILKKLAQQVPTAAAVRELYGLTLYRQGRWADAAKELEAFRLLSGGVEEHPVLADCYRALGDRPRVAELWDELRRASPGAALVTEGRIVMAGSLADVGDLPAAIRLLETGWKLPRRPQDHHLRRAYTLADLYERAGELVRARELFAWISARQPGFADAARRARHLG